MKQGTDLQALQKQLADGAKLSDDARADLAKSLEQKQLALQHAAENAEADYSRERAEIIGRVLKKMAPVLDKFAKDNGFSMILDAQFWPAGPILWASGSTADVTGFGGYCLQRAGGFALSAGSSDHNFVQLATVKL